MLITLPSPSMLESMCPSNFALFIADIRLSKRLIMIAFHLFVLALLLKCVFVYVLSLNSLHIKNYSFHNLTINAE